MDTLSLLFGDCMSYRLRLMRRLEAVSARLSFLPLPQGPPLLPLLPHISSFPNRCYGQWCSTLLTLSPNTTRSPHRSYVSRFLHLGSEGYSLDHMNPMPPCNLSHHQSFPRLLDTSEFYITGPSGPHNFFLTSPVNPTASRP